jgi:hypothetical protein
MPFDLETMVRSEKLDFEVGVEHCSVCPLGTECMDETGDYTGIFCSVMDMFVKCPVCFDEVPRNCPLRKGICTIVVHLNKEK